MKKLAIVPLFALLFAAAYAQEANSGKDPRPKGDAARGEDLFTNTCFDCHNAYSTERKMGPGLKGIKDGKLPSGREASHDAILALINAGIEEMPSFQDKLTEQQKEDIIAFVKTL